MQYILSMCCQFPAVLLPLPCPLTVLLPLTQARARRIACRLEAGMSAINDFAATYTCQSLPFGGVKNSGFDRFAGRQARLWGEGGACGE